MTTNTKLYKLAEKKPWYGMVWHHSTVQCNCDWCKYAVFEHLFIKHWKCYRQQLQC